MIDKYLFPEEHLAVQKLIMRSRLYEKRKEQRRKEKLDRIEECRRALENEEHTSGRDG